MGARARAAYGVASQGVTSLTNFVIVILVARTQDAVTVGSFALGFAVITLGTTIARAGLATPVILSVGAEPRRDVRGGLTLSVVAGCVTASCSMLLIPTGLVSAGLAVVLAACAIAALAQDFLRYSWIARGRPGQALLLDMAWLVALALGSGALLIVGWTPAPALVGTWGIAAVASVVVGVVRDPHARLSVASARGFVKEHLQSAKDLVGEATANSLAANLLPFVVTATVGLAGAGAFRIAQTLFAPLTTAVAGLSPVVLRELSQRLAAGLGTRNLRLSWLGGLGALNLAYGVIVLTLPDSLGRELAGESWPAVSSLLLPLAVLALLRPALTIATLFLRARRRLALLRRASWIFVLPTVAWCGVCGTVWGLAGVGWGQVGDSVTRTSFYSLASWRR